VNEDDRRLIAESVQGNREAFSELVTRYQGRLYNAAVRLVDTPEDAADVVQDAFLNAFQSIRSFKGDSEFFTWMYRIAFNVAVTLKRRKKAALSLNALEPGRNGKTHEPVDRSDYVKPGVALQRSEEEKLLYSAIGRLSSEHRDVLVMKEIDGLKYEEIADLLKIPIGTVRSRLNRARFELRGLLEPHDADIPPLVSDP
jgi:RNA polymerase sigma-70 factor (ECF subfamily)